MNDYEYLIAQLDLLIGFLDVSGREVFEQISVHDSLNIGITVGELYGNNYETFMVRANTKGDENLVQLTGFVLKKRDENTNQNTSYRI